ncbi:MAG: hypothetical protein MJY61_01440 [Bacteroidales bacterium]|nr:hypothetical protein [Bacteroidales bacterium]
MNRKSLCSVLAAGIALLLPGVWSVAAAQEQAYKGWPGHDDISDLKAAFANPPKGYGNVPFYWWTGDSLNLDRLTRQLEILSDASTDGLCVSYNHTHADVDTSLNAAGHGPCGRVSGGEPRVLSAEWRSVWNEFSRRCAQKGIGLGMDDYVVAWPKNGEFIDSILAEPAVRNYQGALKKLRVPSGHLPDNLIVVVSSAEDSTDCIVSEPAPWLYPGLGRRIVEEYFQPFADSMDEQALKGMNYFFQDELQYGLNLRSWCEDMPRQFLSRKGYDIIPHLACLFVENPSELDSTAVRVRLDYAEVLTQLSEERYFKPIYDWNASRGLIYGCDPEGRGLNPVKYLDYFRAISWFTAPGNDAPARGSSFRQTKVSSSIAHMYGRPRTWLEAFHSMGWDANGALLKTQLDHHIIAGGNLLCMHGLYYSTHGGWWEWAPPCFHFRMPYWPHMKLWLRYAERMCFLLSQGTHVCDVAILYPTETMQAIPGSNPGATFTVSENLSSHGIDYDFIDYKSLQRSELRGQSLFNPVSGESYRVLVLADAKAMHRETRQKIEEFRRAGGTVLEDTTGIVGAVRDRLNTDFRSSGGGGRVLHRRIGQRDVYMIMNVAKGDTLYFRSRGKAEIWDAMDGSVKEAPVLTSDSEGSALIYDGENGNSALVVFSPGEPLSGGPRSGSDKVESQAVTGDWTVSFIPTMDNSWGDFRLPAAPGFIGVEAREMNGQTYGYGPYMMCCNPGDVDPDEFLSGGMDNILWTPYVWSWQYGVPDSPGSQGWHGLKSRVDSRFLILDKGGLQVFRTNVYAPAKGVYRLVSEGVSPYRILIDGNPAVPGNLTLGKGWHSLVAAYAGTRKTEYELSRKRGEFLDFRDRAMVMLYPADSEEPREHGMLENVVASKWYGTPFLEFNPYNGAGRREYRFETAPGTVALHLKVNGRINRVTVDGKPARLTRDGDLYTAVPSAVSDGVASVCVTGTPDRGCPGASFFAEPVCLDCREGKMPAGDWSAYGALAFYSGAVRYVKDIDIHAGASSVTLNLGDVDATCEVSVNGRKAGTLIGSPYSVDISSLVKEGSNRVEVLVYSSLANHYRTVPSPYRGTPRAGLLGPVVVKYR